MKVMIMITIVIPSKECGGMWSGGKPPDPLFQELIMHDENENYIVKSSEWWMQTEDEPIAHPDRSTIARFKWEFLDEYEDEYPNKRRVI